MILLWRPRSIATSTWRRYSRLWFRFAASTGEAVQTRDISAQALRQEWDRVNITPGRMVAWVKPTFIPTPEFFDELDHYLDEGYRVVAQTLDGQLDQNLLVFQLAGQTELALPTSGETEPEAYLMRDARHILRLPLTTIINGPHRVSALGAVFSTCSPAWELYLEGWARWTDATWRQT